MIVLNDELKKFLSKKFGVDEKLIYAFQFEDSLNKYKMIYQDPPHTKVRYIDSKIMRNYTLRLKLEKLLHNIRIKKLDIK
jgi:hypothetical protein